MQQSKRGGRPCRTKTSPRCSNRPQRTTWPLAARPVVKTFFEETTRIETWSVEAISCLGLGTVAVCAYDWAERGQHAGQAFELAGTTTDVLGRRGTGWVHQAHHVTLLTHIR